MVTIAEDYVSFETAKLLKEKGFPQEYDDYHALVYNEEDYEDEYEIQRMVLKTKLVKTGTLSSYPIGVPEPKCYCPTLQMAMKWLREMHNLFIEIQCYGCEADKKAHFEYSYVISEYVKINTGICTIFGLEKRNAKSRFPSYETACEAAVKYCLEHLI